MKPDRKQLACTGKANLMCADQPNPHRRQRQIERAKAICATCPLLERCRAWVLSKDEDPSPVMVVGGMSPEERRKARFGSEACGTDRGWQRHRKRGEQCAACLAAHNEYTREHMRAWRAKQRQTQRGAA